MNPTTGGKNWSVKIPATDDPGHTEYFMNHITGGKYIIASNPIDTMKVFCTNIRGNNALSLDKCLITILLDQVTHVPNPPKN